jgi:NADPH-dependent 2,4-dienoyl-CoA reductase/sulfur reductase-like enzyme
LGKDSLELLYGNGRYKVDKTQKTSDNNVYAVNDCTNIYYNGSGNVLVKIILLYLI